MIVDIEKGTVERTLDLPVAPVEMVVITGHAETSTEHADHSDHEGHEDEGHEGHDH